MSVTRLTTNGLAGTKYDIASADNYYMEPIATTLLGTATGTVTFSNIPQNYKHLQIRAIARNTGTASSGVGFQLNGDTTASYSWHRLYADGSSATSYGEANSTIFGQVNITQSNQTASAFGVFVLDILDYANVNKFKTGRLLHGRDLNGSGTIALASSNWRNTAAITSILIFPASDNFDTNSRFSLYGIKG